MNIIKIILRVLTLKYCFMNLLLFDGHQMHQTVFCGIFSEENLKNVQNTF